MIQSTLNVLKNESVIKYEDYSSNNKNKLDKLIENLTSINRKYDD